MKLKPCPFCGGEACLLQNYGYDGHFEVLCGCGGRVTCYDTEEVAIEAWNRRQQMNWISVDEKLPEDLEEVICLMPDGRVNNQCHDRYGWIYGSPTHWMPLPKPPKEDE